MSGELKPMEYESDSDVEEIEEIQEAQTIPR